MFLYLNCAVSQVAKSANGTISTVVRFRQKHKEEQTPCCFLTLAPADDKLHYRMALFIVTE